MSFSTFTVARAGTVAKYVATRTWLFILSSAALSTPGAAQEPVPAQLRGRVKTRFDVPLPAVEVTIPQMSRTTLTDSLGRFVLSGLAAGEHVILVRRIGFRGQLLSANLHAGETKDVTIVMETGVWQLPEIEVTAKNAKPVEYAYTTRYDDFFRRRSVGLGHYITRDEIERRKPWRTANILVGIAGIKISFRHPGATGTDVEISRCGGLPGEKVSVWIDGWKQKNPEFELPSGQATRGAMLGALLDRVLPSQIEMVEVYRGPAEMPAEFLDDSCAAIVIWTR